MWIFVPIGGMTLAYLFHNLVQKHIFNHPEARRRVIILMPYQMTLTTYLMLAVAVLKNYRFETGPSSQISQKLFSPASIIPLLIAFPLTMLPIFRLYLLRKARGLNQIGITRNVK